MLMKTDREILESMLNQIVGVEVATGKLWKLADSIKSWRTILKMSYSQADQSQTFFLLSFLRLFVTRCFDPQFVEHHLAFRVVIKNFWQLCIWHRFSPLSAPIESKWATP